MTYHMAWGLGLRLLDCNLLVMSRDSTASVLTDVMSAAKLESRVSINESIDRQLELTLRQFVTFKTVSSDRNLREQCYCGAKYLCKILVEVLGMCRA